MLCLQRTGHLFRPLNLYGMTLLVGKSQQIQLIAGLSSNSGRDGGVQATAGEYNSSFLKLPGHRQNTLREDAVGGRIENLVAIFFSFDFLQQLGT
jgi:hypothetical protein